MPAHAHVPTPQTRRTVEAMTAYGVREPDIARVIGIAERTLRKYYRTELDQGLAKANSKVADTLYLAATSAVVRDKDGNFAGTDRGGITACIFWLKTRARWHEKVAHVGGDPEDPPIRQEVTHRKPAGEMTEEEAEAFLAEFQAGSA